MQNPTATISSEVPCESAPDEVASSKKVGFSTEMSVVNNKPEMMNLSFSGCGFLCIYHAGVAAAIKEYAPHLTKNKIAGASAGSIIAAGLICNVCISQATSTVLKVVSEARSRAGGALNPQFDLMQIVRTEMIRVLPPNAYELCTDHLFISLSRWRDNKNVVVSKFESNEDLLDAIICSCFIPFYCGITPPYYQGEQYIDGGLTDNQPTLDEHSITVSPFSGESDICPPDWDSASFLCFGFSGTSIRFTTRNLFRMTAALMPASLEDCSKMCLQGFEDALRFLTKNGMAPCIRCLTIQTNVDDAIPCSDKESESVKEASLRTLSPPILSTRTRLTSNLQSVSSRRVHFHHEITTRDLLEYHLRKRLDSECDTCCESEHMYNTMIAEIFPPIIRKKFEEAAAVEASLLTYLLSFRVVRYTRNALGLTKLPIDMMLLLAKNLSQWMAMIAVPEWLQKRLSKLINFVYEEFENQKSLYSARFSCQLSLTEERRSSRRHDLLSSIEASEDAKKERALLRARDKGKNAKKAKTTDAPAARVSREWSYLPEEDHDMDSTDRVVEYMQGHDAMYEFHYKDENNQVHSFGLFNMQNPERRHSCHSPHDSANSPTSGPVARTPRPVSMVVEEEEEAVEQQCSSKKDEEDSGLSVEEASGKQTRDACCSPVRDWNVVGRGSPSASHASSSHSRTPGRSNRIATVPSRRHTGHATHPPRKAANRDMAAMMSSDSEADLGEQFFVPRGRVRTSSREYEGEVEQSDTDR